MERFEEVMRKQLCDPSEAPPEAPTNQKHPAKHKGDKANRKQQLKRQQQAQRELLYTHTAMLSPATLSHAGVPIYRLVQVRVSNSVNCRVASPKP